MTTGTTASVILNEVKDLSEPETRDSKLNLQERINGG
jgi:hypothetical protein